MRSFDELAATRRTVRRYRPDPVPREAIEAVLEAARWAPSGMNMQPWEFVVVTDEETRRELGDLARYYVIHSQHVGAAPVVIAVCGRKGRGPFVRDDCIFAGANILLAAADRGLGTCWIGGFKEEKVKQLLRIPRSMTIVGLVTLGYEDGKTKPPPRREVPEMVHWEAYGSAEKALRLRDLRRWGPQSVLRKFLAEQKPKHPKKGTGTI